jgi:hypothetical protein
MTYDPTMRSKPHVERREREARRRRDTFEKIFNGEADIADDIAKARDRHDVGARGLGAAVSEHVLDMIDFHRRRLGIAKSGDQTAKELPMDKTETLRDIAKAGGIIALAKAITDENRSYGITEHEFVELVTEHAKAAHPELTEAQAFAKLYEIPEVWRACAVAKSAPFAGQVLDYSPHPLASEAWQPSVTSGDDWRNADDARQAWDQLARIGRKLAPTATPERQFAVAFEAPENAALAQRVHQRPGPTMAYAFPTAARTRPASMLEIAPAGRRAYAKADHGGEAYNELMAKAEEYRSAHPELSVAQCFEKVYTDPANRDISKRERFESTPR